MYIRNYLSAFLITIVLCDFISCSEAHSKVTSITERTSEYVEQQSTYLEMPDGIRIAAEIFLPAGASSTSNLPTIIKFTRYWRNMEYEPKVTDKNGMAKLVNNSGYAFVVVDTRGSGASFGVRGTEFSTCETSDFKHVIDWVAKQAWSNGRVATIGISYAGNTAENAMLEFPSPLKATIPRFTDFDIFTSILFPGGMLNQVIFKTWGNLVRDLDNNIVPDLLKGGAEGSPKLVGVKPVDGDSGRKLLDEAISEHTKNTGVQDLFEKAIYRDDMFIAEKLNESCEKAISIYKFKQMQTLDQTPAFHWASWTDAGTAAGVLSRFASYNAPNHYIIGPWTHGARLDTNPMRAKDHPLDMSFQKQYEMIFKFLDPLLTDSKTNNKTKQNIKRLDYFTMGENKWKSTYIWPPANSEYVDWYLSSNQTLKPIPEGKKYSKDDYKVDFNAGTGKSTRWSTQLGTDVFYGDRVEEDNKLLLYTSGPLSEDIEITGTAIVELYMSSTHEDGAVIAYLEAINADGEIMMITEGELRLIHRKEITENAEFETFGPYHSFKKVDASPMSPGKVEKVSFVLLPTSIVIPKGYSIRLAIAGHDKDTFSRYPKSGNPTYSIYRSTVRASKLTLPIIRK